MFVRKERDILVDCDGVLLDWEYSFSEWMETRGYRLIYTEQYEIKDRYNISKLESLNLIREFNNSAWVGKLRQHKDAVKYIKKLNEEHGYVFHVISSFSTDVYAHGLRIQNLKEIFGNVFKKFVFLDVGQSKEEALAEYKESGCYWIEDLNKNAEDGLRQGLTPILMKHKYNEVSTDYRCVGDWAGIYNIIVENKSK